MDNNNTTPSADLSIDPTMLAPQGTAPAAAANTSHLIDITPGVVSVDPLASPVSPIAPVMTAPLPEPKVLDITPPAAPESPAESPLLTNLVPPVAENPSPLTEVVPPVSEAVAMPAATPVAIEPELSPLAPVAPISPIVESAPLAPITPVTPVAPLAPVSPVVSPLAEDPNQVQTIG